MAKLVVDEIVRLLGLISTTDLDAMRPADRELFRQLLERWAKLAADPPPPGVLSDLQDEPRDG